MVSWREYPNGTTASGRDFRTTHWTVVLAASREASPGAEQALAELCQAYWFPIYAYVRRWEHDPDQAKDLTQEFFARLLEKNYLQTVDPRKGRFRSFLLGSLKHFMANEWHRCQTAKRGGGRRFISWDEEAAEERYRREPFHELTPERIYEQTWALALLEQVHRQLEEEYASAGKIHLFKALEDCLCGERTQGGYADRAKELGMTEAAVKMTVHRLRRGFQARLRAQIAQTVESEDEVEDEIRHLCLVVSR
jgi:RNA polymerase sigma factor (sigma-70 family)